MPVFAVRSVIAAVLSVNAALFAEDIYRKPQEIIDGTLIAKVEAVMESGGVVNSEDIASLNAALDRYEREFVAGRHIEDERRAESLSYRNLNADASRILSLFRELSYGRRHFIAEAPYLFRIHRTLAGYYANGDPLLALNHYAASLRYAAIPPACPVAEMDEEEADAHYLSIARIFSDPERVAQANDPYGVDSRNFRSLFESYRTLKLQYEEAVKVVDVARAARARGLSDPDESGARMQMNSLKAELDIAIGRMEGIRLGSYKGFCTDRRGALASIFASMSDLHERLTGDPRGDGRITMLEHAHRLVPESPVYMDRLVGILIHTNHFERAIDLEEQWIEIAKRSGVVPPATHYQRLGSLYIAKRNWIRASESYEEFMKAEVDPEKRRAILLPLADLHITKTGRLERAAELYGEYLELTRNEIPADDRKASDLYLLRYGVYRKLSSIHRRNQRPGEEGKSLRSAVEQVRALEKIADTLRTSRDAIQKRINELNLKIRDREDRSSLRDYYRLKRVDLPEAEEKLNVLESGIKSIDFPVILERLAFLAAGERRFEDALVNYAEIIRRGSGDQAARARRNAQRLQLTMRDGIARELEPSHDFER
jgi:tetratricopeptide (TPR) repeat protein